MHGKSRKIITSSLALAMLLSNLSISANNIYAHDDKTDSLSHEEANYETSILNDNDTNTLKNDSMQQVIEEKGFKLQVGEYLDSSITGVIIEYSGDNKNITIPTEIGGYKVRGIGENVFKNKNLTNVELQDGIEYIGKSAFENNRIKEMYIPDSVTTIKESAFLAVNNQSSSETIITGMKGITALEDNVFGKIYKLSLDIPSLSEVNKNSFLPEPDLSYVSPYYVRLYTKNNNKYKLESQNGLYLIDPACVVVRGIDSNTNAVLRKPTRYVTSFGTKYDRNTDINNFYKIGSTSADHSVNDEIQGYLKPIEKKSTEISDIENSLDFEYKSIIVSSKVDTETKMISGKVFNGEQGIKNAKVKISKSLDDRGRSWSTVVDNINTDDNGYFKYEINEISDGANFKIEAKYEDSKYIGKSFENFVSVRQGKGYSIDKVNDLEPIRIKAGEDLNIPSEIKVHYNDGSMKNLRIMWNESLSDTINKNIAGEYWKRGIVEESIDGKMISNMKNKHNVFLQIEIDENDEIKDADKSDLIRLIEEASENLMNTLESSDGSDILITKSWVTKDAKKSLDDFIEKAKKVRLDPKIDQDGVDTALKELREAIKIFDNSKQLGKMTGDASQTSTFELLAIADNLTEKNMNDFSVKMRNYSKNKVKGWSKVEHIKDGIVGHDTVFFKYVFDLTPGEWRVEAPKGWIITTEDGNMRNTTPYVTISSSGHTFDKEFRFKKGLEVKYDLGEHGYTSDATEQYYLSREHLSEKPSPVVTPHNGWIFEGWSFSDDSNIINAEFAVTKDITLKAVYAKEKGAINKNTKVGGVWTVGDFTYEKETNDIDTKGQWKVTGFSQTGKDKILKHYDLYIPHVTPDGNPVTIIGEAYKNGVPEFMKGSFANYGITTLYIPDTITDIYGWAFQGNSIKTLNLPDSVKHIGVLAFWKSGIEEIHIPNSVVEINNGAFQDNLLKEVRIPKGVKLINTTTFEGNKLEKVYLEEGLEQINKSAFKNNRLKVVNLPKSVKKIHEEAFLENNGLTHYGGKVGLVIGNGDDNPNNLKSGLSFVINPEVIEDTSSKKKELKNYLLAIEQNNNATFSSIDGSDVPSDEKWLRPEIKIEMREALYAGYYAYYDDTSSNNKYDMINTQSHPKFTVEQAIKMLREVGIKAKDSVKNGTNKRLSKKDITLMVGIPGVEYPTDLKNYHQDTYVLRDRNNEKSRAYSYKSVLNAVPNLAYLKYSLPEGNYELDAPVGMVYVHQEGINGKTVQDDNTYVDVPSTNLLHIGYSSEEGCVIVYDLMDDGTSDDMLYETVMRENGARKIPKVIPNEGYRFKSWSLDGKTPTDIKKLKVTGNIIVKALYEKDNESHVDKKYLEELKSSLVESRKLLRETKISIDGNDIDIETKWVPKNIYEELKTKTDEIEKDLDSINKSKAEALKKSLDEILDRFKKNMQNGKKTKASEDDDTNIEKKELKSLLDSANELLSDTIESDNGKDVDPDKYWVNSMEKNAFEKIIIESNFIDEDEEATQDDVNIASENLKKAIEVFKRIRKAGIKNNEDKPEPVNPDKPKPVNPDKPEPVNPDKPEPVNPDKPEPVNPDKPKPVNPDKPEPVNPDKPKPVNPDKPNTINSDTLIQKDKIISDIHYNRISGSDRINTAIKLSKEYYDRADTVIIVSGDTFADSMSASVLAHKLSSPVLISNKNILNKNILKEIKRLGAKKVVIVGGKNSIDEKIVSELNKNVDNVERLSGKDRYDTSVEVAKKIFDLNNNHKSKKIVIASGEVFADALSIGAYAAKQEYPIILTEKDKISYSVNKFIFNERINEVYIIGGENTISTRVESQLSCDKKRIYGVDRYDTSIKIAESLFGDSKKVYVASGEKFADALVGAPIGARNNMPILLSPFMKRDNRIESYIKNNRIREVIIIGGEESILDSAIK
ncbi:cell wall-binding repeat-containing protein [Peptostreptococcus porci]|uniref:cell wall-binding repeat-containing protein n=1 Tax=Peptostreptococcus porci TaxID=2652282 RepID=UPI002A90D56C|nr:cell wall-binding repeat-containing protein [Peptostreptococcus porci]MDY5435114.1 cell wall-binding repeat-containing protein [Peptostreptococcus porci]